MPASRAGPGASPVRGGRAGPRRPVAAAPPGRPPRTAAAPPPRRRRISPPTARTAAPSLPPPPNLPVLVGSFRAIARKLPTRTPADAGGQGEQGLGAAGGDGPVLDVPAPLPGHGGQLGLGVD